MIMSKFRENDLVKFVGPEVINGIHPGSCGTIVEVLEFVLLSYPHISIYKVEFDSGMTLDILELNDNQLELVDAAKLETNPAQSSSDDADPYEIPMRNWKKIIDYLENAVDAMLEDGNVEQAIKYTILLEQAVYAWTADNYSFEGKI